ncbi:hypothetical protein [Altererythrobacter sp. TH136]|uniref:hypothetical protein n=1 Tax=Altererythrobacter sp. TH136 TaxID=2067415 RepID=UPI001162DEEB|nr:hypothetical protein [Altererythrobacter sp. TH136]QDM41417.1 hypothetical protein C0V74_10485 [Altererythrobacter sp. TH136]
MPISELAPYLGYLIGGGFLLGIGGILASVHTTRLKIKNGYPLEGMWGQSLKPNTDKEAVARVQLLTQENAQLKAEVGAMRERLETIERIVTDGGFRLTHEIERLRGSSEKVQ